MTILPLLLAGKGGGKNSETLALLLKTMGSGKKPDESAIMVVNTRLFLTIPHSLRGSSLLHRDLYDWGTFRGFRVATSLSYHSGQWRYSPLMTLKHKRYAFGFIIRRSVKIIINVPTARFSGLRCRSAQNDIRISTSLPQGAITLPLYKTKSPEHYEGFRFGLIEFTFKLNRAWAP